MKALDDTHATLNKDLICPKTADKGSHQRGEEVGGIRICRNCSKPLHGQ
jgi:hypothetical protein